MLKIVLQNSNLVASVDDEDFDKVIGFSWTAHKKGSHWYAMTHIGTQTIWMHHLILPLLDDGKTVDHKNGDGLDNQKNNLRYATSNQQMANRGHGRTRKGVFKYRNGNWRAQIIVNKKAKHLGYFDDPAEAALAYNKAALEYFGEFAQLNKI